MEDINTINLKNYKLNCLFLVNNKANEKSIFFQNLFENKKTQ